MRNSHLITLYEPQSMISESYKMLRTNLNYINIDKEYKILLFTSSVSDEGKTASIANIAVSFAISGKKTLLIECDLRKACIHGFFSLSETPGLINILAGKKELHEVVQSIDKVEGLHILTSGPLPQDPVEMLSSHAFESLIEDARRDYEMILIDAPPVISVTDTTVLCRVADGVIFIIAADETKKDDALKAKRMLEKVGAHILGALMTKADVRKERHYYSYLSKQKHKQSSNYSIEY